MPGTEERVLILRSRLERPAPMGLRRARLVDPLAHPSAPSLTTVVAAAGCGKTTLLAHVAATVHHPVGWLTVDGELGDPARFLAHLHAACAALLGRPDLAGDHEPGASAGAWTSVEAALCDLQEGLTGPALLVLDEVQAVDGTPSGRLVEALVLHQPRRLRLALGSRTPPPASLPRRLAGTAALVDGEALRFRTWEVEELFRACHGVRLRADEVAALTHRTAGWAAGLEFFHLATRGQPGSSRARLLNGAGGGHMPGDYLARHVLDQLPGEVRDFLVRTSVLADLTAERCDELLGTDDSVTYLEHARRVGVLAAAAGATGTAYRCQEVMRAHLLDSLAARDGGPRARELHRRAAGLALGAGEYDEALRSYCRAQDWEAARDVLAVGGCDLAGRPGSWIDVLPAPIRDTDPWVALALARRLVADGQLAAALAAYRRAGERCATETGRGLVASEQRMVQTWLEPPLGAVTDWVALTRAALATPRTVLARGVPAGPERRFGHAVARLVAGELTAARGEFAAISGDAGVAPVTEALALLGEAVTASLACSPDARDTRERAAEAAKLLGAPALERLTDALDLACGPTAGSSALPHLADRSDALGDRWGAELTRLLGAAAALTGRGDPSDVPVPDFGDLGADALGLWSDVVAALLSPSSGARGPSAAPPGRGRPAGRLRDLERAAATIGPLPHALALLTTGAAADRLRAARLADACGARRWVHDVLRRLPAPPDGDPPSPRRTVVPDPAPDGPADAADRIDVRCLGGFELRRGGVPVDVAALRPQHQALLRALCTHAPAPVRREQLVEWFWPGKDPERAQHSLQVAVSEVRGLLDSEGARGDPVPGGDVARVPTRLRRDGAGYALALGPGDHHDARLVEREVTAGDAALARGDGAEARARFGAAVAGYPADLLPDDGAAEWAAPERDRLRALVVGACEVLAQLCADDGDHDGATAVARTGIRLDRYRDALWLRLVESLAVTGQPAAAAAARREYAVVLAELDLPVAVTRVTPAPRPGPRPPSGRPAAVLAGPQPGRARA